MLKFKNIVFSPENSAITLEKLGFFCDLNSGFVQVQIAGENKDTQRRQGTVLCLLLIYDFRYFSTIPLVVPVRRLSCLTETPLS